MQTQLTRNWWWVALRGIAAIVFGILAFIWPGTTFLVLVLFFGAYALVDGIFGIITALTHRAKNDRWWVLLLEGVVSLAAGLITLLLPGLAAFTLLLVIAAWAIVTGILEIVAAIRLRTEIQGEWLYVLSGILSIVFGIVVFLNPAAGSLAIAWVIGAYAIIFGILFLALAWRLRNLGTPQARTATGTV